MTKDETVALFTALQGMWPQFEKHLQRRKQSHVESLITSNNEEIRGRIKEINDLLQLPHELLRDMQQRDALPDEGASL